MPIELILSLLANLALVAVLLVAGAKLASARLERDDARDIAEGRTADVKSLRDMNARLLGELAPLRATEAKRAAQRLAASKASAAARAAKVAARGNGKTSRTAAH